MATITYQCNICNRQIDLVENSQGLTTFGKCVITNGCKGKLNKIKRNLDNVREVFPPEISGLQDYVQRRALYTFTQTLPATSWTIEHNLGTSPAVDIYVNDVNGDLGTLNPELYTTQLIDKNTISVAFNSSYTGMAQLISRSSVKLQPKTLTPVIAPVQVTANGVFIFGVPKYLTKFEYPPTLLPTPSLPYDLSMAPIRIEVSIQRPNTEEEICTEYLDATLFDTPWNDWNEALVRKRKNYYLLSKNILEFRTFGEDTTTFASIPDGTQLKITRIDYGTGVLQPIDSEGLLIFLSQSPFTSADKITNSVIDASDMVDNTIPYFEFRSTDFYVDSSCVEKTYPNILRLK